MGPEDFKRLEERVSKLETFIVKLGQKVLDLQGSQRPEVSPVAPATAMLTPIENRMRPSSLWGLILLYFFIYLAYGYFGLISAGTSFLLMAGTTTFGAFFSLKRDSLNSAVLVSVVGFLTPYFFGLRATSEFGYFVYTLILNTWVLYASFLKDWRPVITVGLVGTISHFSSWHFLFYASSKLNIALYVLTIFYLIYLVAYLANRFVVHKKNNRGDLLLLILSSTWFIAELYYLL